MREVIRCPRSHSDNSGRLVSSPSFPDPHAVKILLSDEIETGSQSVNAKS